MTKANRRSILKTIGATGIGGLAASNTVAAEETERKPWRNQDLETISKGLFVELGVEFDGEIDGNSHADAGVPYIVDESMEDLVFPAFPSSQEEKLIRSPGIVSYRGYHPLAAQFQQRETKHVPVTTSPGLGPTLAHSSDESVLIPPIMVSDLSESTSIEVRFGGTTTRVPVGEESRVRTKQGSAQTITPDNSGAPKTVTPELLVKNNGVLTYKKGGGL